MEHRSLERDVRDARLIARTEFWRTLRAIRANDSRFASVVVLALFTVPVGLVWLYGAYAVGKGVDVGPRAAPVIGSFVLPAVAGFAATVAVQTVQDGPFPDQPTLPLSIVSTRAVVLSKLLAALAAVAVWLVVPTVVFGGAFLAGAGSPLLAPLVAVWLVPLVLAAVPLGYLAGLWLTRLNHRLPVPTAGKALVWAAVVLGSIAVGQGVGYVVAEEGVGSLAVGFLPAFGSTTAYASLLFGGEKLLFGLAVGVTLLAVGAVAARRATTDATELWFADRPDRAESDPEGSRRPPTPFSWTKTGRIAWHYLRLAVRSPRRLAHLLFLLFLLFPLAGPLADASLAALRFAPSVGVLACALLTGATFCLNPVGDERGTLPVVVLSGTDAAAFVRGRILAGLVIGLAVVVACIVLGAAVGVSSVALVALVLFAAGLSIAAGGVAAGFGVLVPKHEPEEIFGVETVRPSNVSVFAFEIGTLAVGGVGLLLIGAPEPTLGTVRAHLPFALPYAAVVAAGGAVGYLVAVRRLRAWTVER